MTPWCARYENLPTSVKRKKVFGEKGRGIQWMRSLVRISTAKAIQSRGPDHSVNRQTPKTENSKVPEGHHPRGTTLREALQGNLPLRGLCGGLSEGSVGSLRGLCGVSLGLCGGPQDFRGWWPYACDPRELLEPPGLIQLVLTVLLFSDGVLLVPPSPSFIQRAPQIMARR